ncbi:hypothetical protein CCACVL1_08275 [Corchorus capsularis]|uniref:Uncharacterized protein n=1 Tax=Corchorus capsularis TaxID=210143 RepID=A0A1R3J1G2_COCAP|nr:hypothetical protein CCACVL1_08275 [Corchorus capsularis]
MAPSDSHLIKGPKPEYDNHMVHKARTQPS